MRIPRWLALPLASLIVATACGGATTGGPAPVAVKLTDGKLVIGVINDQSGVYADLSGKNAVEAVNMAVADFKAKYGENALGGPIEVISADHKNDPALASSKATEFYERSNADIILDVPTSSGALAIAKVAGEQKKLYINITAASTDLTGPACNKYTFHYAYDTYMLATAGTTVAAQGGKNWQIIYPDYAFGQDMAKSFTAAVKKGGGTVNGTIATPFPNDNFATFLTKAAAAKPQVIGAMQAGGDLVTLVKQFNEQKLRQQGIQLAAGLLLLPDLHSAGVDQFQGVTFTDPWYWNFDAQNRAWAEKFRAKTGTYPSFEHAANYSAAMQYLEAVQAAGTDDADTIVKAFEGKKVNDFFLRNGEFRAKDHSVIHDVYLAKVKTADQVKQAWDYEEIVKTIPAAEAFKPVSESICVM